MAECQQSPSIIEERRETFDHCSRPSEVTVNRRRQSMVPCECHTSEATYDEVSDDGCHRQQSPENLMKIGVFHAILATIDFYTNRTAYRVIVGIVVMGRGPKAQTFAVFPNIVKAIRKLLF